ncbi:MAG TPA: amidohydrolase [Nocardioidaceae bacterium]|nr:amidohydrolase [Nocardioidaceae bacterium]
MTQLPSDADLVAVYEDLHAHPELAFQEHRTAAVVAEHLLAFGYDVHTGIGGTGVLGLLERGPGPTVLLRADMDGLPVREQTGLGYASTQWASDHQGREVPVMHACGHDVHVTCLIGAAAQLSVEDGFRGRLMVVFQPAEELGVGARAMVEDGLYDRFGTPDVVLGQHVAPLPTGVIGMHAGVAMAASDTLAITLHGRGGHGSRPETTVDPIVMAAATVLRLQTVVSRETAGTDAAVVTVGTLHAGAAANVIPETAELTVNVRTFDGAVRDQVLAAVTRIVHAEAQASAAPRAPEIEHADHFPSLTNDEEALERVRRAFTANLPVVVIDPGLVTGSEDVGVFAEAAGVPCVFWLLGGADPQAFAGLTSEAELRAMVGTLPSNHSPYFAPVAMPTLRLGVDALVTGARTWEAR